MIIGISGKIGSGKDTIGKIIQILTDSPHFTDNAVVFYLSRDNHSKVFEIKKYADKPKDIVCLLIGCTREQLENRDFKEKELGEEWVRYAYADGHNDHYRDGKYSTTMNSVWCDKSRYEAEKKINWQTAYKSTLTPRLMMQLLGTECGREIIHPNIWVNALMSTYVPTNLDEREELLYPNWIITDVRFPNEASAIRERKGVLIRVEADKRTDSNVSNHESETALDSYSDWDFVVYNNGTLIDLVQKVRTIIWTLTI